MMWGYDSNFCDSKRDGIGGVGGLYDDEDESDSDSVPDVYLSVYLSRDAPVCAGGVEGNAGAGGVE